MNREILLEASIAVTVGLLVATLAAYRSQQAPKPAVMRRGAMAALLVYAENSDLMDQIYQLQQENFKMQSVNKDL